MFVPDFWVGVIVGAVATFFVILIWGVREVQKGRDKKE